MKKKTDNNWERNRKLYIIVCCVLLVLSIAIIIAVAFTSCSGGSYKKYLDEGQEAFVSGNFNKAIDKFSLAIDEKPTEEAYILLASSYLAKGDEAMAMQVLYLGYSHTGSDDIYLMIDKLSSGSASLSDIIVTPSLSPNAQTVTIAGRAYGEKSATITLSSQGLSDNDLQDIIKLKELESLSATDNTIRDPAALTALQGLTYLQLSNNRISDASSLSRLSKLETLYLDGNPITDFSTLHSLTNLRTLSIKGIPITESQLGALQKALPNCRIYSEAAIVEIKDVSIGGRTFKADVTELDLSGLNLVDIRALADCTELRSLKLSNNGLADLSALVDMQKLEYLDISGNNVSDITNLMSLTQLKTLNIANNYVRDISPLGYIVKLENLDLSGNRLEGGENAIGRMTNLKNVNLSSTGCTDAFIEQMLTSSALASLNITGNSDISANIVDKLKDNLPNCVVTADDLLYTIALGDYTFKSDVSSIYMPDLTLTELENIEHFTSLRELNLANGALTTIEGLKDLTGLEDLELYCNHVTDISPLQGHTSLRILDIISNGCSNISALSSCTGLEELYASGNGISDISALKSCGALKLLYLDGNSITDVKALAGLTHLTTLLLDNNSISDFEPLYGLTGLRTLSLYGTGITAEQADELQEALPDCQILWA